MTRVVVLAATLLVVGQGLPAQGYRLRLDTRMQTAAYRGVEPDSIPTSAAVIGPSGGTETPDGFAVTCDFSAYCRFFRPGASLRSAPLTQQADLTAWGFGVPGVSVRMTGRLLTDLSSADAWPGTEPAVQLLEGYAEYAGAAVTVRGGRQLLSSRLGPAGFDGGRLVLRHQRTGLEAELYGGWSLARATALPITSPVLNPLDEYRPAARGLLLGAAAGWSGAHGSVRADYQRELERDTRYFISERAALSGEFRPARRWSLAAGGEYDIAQGWWGTADAQLRYSAPKLNLSVGGRHYRPYFDLWTIWGAFSPVPYNSAIGSIWVQPTGRLELRANGERYRFAATETSTPLVDVERDGWRTGLGATFTVRPGLTADADLNTEFGPGASSRQLEGAVTYAPSAAFSLSARVASLRRPLELRFDDASVTMVGFDADFALGERLRVGLGAAHFAETRNRPDAATLDWNQTRLYARVTALFGTSADRAPLPPARRSRRSAP